MNSKNYNKLDPHLDNEFPINEAIMSIIYYGKTERIKHHQTTLKKIVQLEENAKVNNPEHYQAFKAQMEQLRTVDLNPLKDLNVEFIVFFIFNRLKEKDFYKFLKAYEELFWQTIPFMNKKTIDDKINAVMMKIEQLYWIKNETD